MDLLIALGFLYGLQCATWLTRGAELFVKPLRTWVVSSGPGWRLLHPLPSGRSSQALRFPLVEHEGHLHGRGAVTWLSGQGWGTHGAPVSLAALGEATVHRSVVRVGGRAFARGSSPAHAESLARLLRDYAKAGPRCGRESMQRAFEEGLSLARYSAARARVDAATRWLGWSSDIYWVGLFGLLPVFLAWMGEERGLLLALPVLAAFHFSTLAAFAIAHRQLRPGSTGALVESLVAAACYPPLLLRAHHTLRTQELASFHPAVIAAAVLPEEDRRAFLRAELVRASERSDAASRRCDRPGLDELESRALWCLARELGESAETLLTPPPRQDPFVETYCPACLCEYRCAAGRCTECRVALISYGA